MQIHIDTAEPLSDTDKQILGVLSGTTAKVAPAAKTAAPAAKKVAAAPAKAEVEEPEEVSDGPTLADAKALASKVVADGKAKEVKAALESVGAKKVSEIADDKVADFIAALS